MKLADKINNVLEGMHHDTKVKQLEGMGSRKARLTVKAAKKMVENMLNPSHPSPNPKTETDKVYLKESIHMMDKTMEKLKTVRDSRRTRVREDLDEAVSGPISKVPLHGDALLVADALTIMLRGKFIGDKFDLIDFLDSYWDDFDSNIKEDKFAEVLIALYKQLK